MEWYHTYLLHPGETRTEETIAQHLYWPNIPKTVQEHVKTCEKCQLAKRKRLKYGHVPIKNVDTETQPWRRLCVDCIGPYKIKRRNKPPLEFQAVTMIDPATSWFEMRQFKDKKGRRGGEHGRTDMVDQVPNARGNNL